jgi:hypothetical protein
MRTHPRQTETVLFVMGALAGGWCVGGLLGGSLGRLERLGLHHLPLVVAAVLVQLGGTLFLRGTAYATALIASLLLAGFFVLRNPQLPGRGLIIGGLSLNALVIAANGAMPVATEAANRAGVSISSLRNDPRHALIDAHTHLSWLADRIPLALPWQPQVLSVGDVLVAAGVGLLVATGMRRGAGKNPAVSVRKAPAEFDQLLR